MAQLRYFILHLCPLLCLLAFVGFEFTVDFQDLENDFFGPCVGPTLCTLLQLTEVALVNVRVAGEKYQLHDRLHREEYIDVCCGGGVFRGALCEGWFEVFRDRITNKQLKNIN